MSHSYSRAPLSLTIRALSLGLLSLCIFCGSAHAQWKVQDDEQIKNANSEYEKTKERWDKTNDHFEQQLIKLQAISVPALAKMNNEVGKRSEQSGISVRCGEYAPGTLERPDTWGSEPVVKSNNAEQTQAAICARTLANNNRKFNDMVGMLQYVADTREAMDRLDARRKGIEKSKSQGELAALDYDATRLNDALALQFRYWESRNRSYDATNEYLKDQQKQLSNRTLDGDSTLLSRLGNSLVKTGTLYLALCLDDPLTKSIVNNPYREGYDCL